MGRGGSGAAGGGPGALPRSALRPRVRVGATGAKAERFLKLPIASRTAQVRKVALWLGPEEGQPPLPDLQPGDRLQVSAELALTTDCEARRSDCVGEPYGYEPTVESQLLLSADPKATGPGPKTFAITRPRREQLSHARHHHVVVYDHIPYEVPALRWSGPSYICLVVSAGHPDARRNQVLIVGQNDPGGAIQADMSGLSLVRFRGASEANGTSVEVKKVGAPSVPVVKGATQVVYSQPLETLMRGEQLSVRVSLDTSAEKLRGPARASVRVFLADGPTETGPGEHAKQVTASRGDVSRKNGTNRLPGEPRGSSLKTGVLRMTKTAEKPLFLNTTVETGDPLKRAQPGDVLRILDGGTQRVVRFGAQLDG